MVLISLGNLFSKLTFYNTRAEDEYKIKSLDDGLLVNAYIKAKELNLTRDFIILLEKEILWRGITIVDPLNQKVLIRKTNKNVFMK